MIELLVTVLKMLVVLIVFSIIYTIGFAWDVSDRRNPRARKRGAKMVEQLVAGIFFMFVLCIFIFGGIKCLM